MTLLEMLVPTYEQMLRALSAWLAKTEAQKGEEEAQRTLEARLAPDMFPLATQIRFACVQALEGMARLRGEAFPEAVAVLLDEGRNAGARPGTIADAQARIAETLAAVSAAAAGAPAVDPTAPLEHALPHGMIFDLTAGGYVRDWALPQFYFHVMTAYALLRAEGTDLGKTDFIPHMFAYVRPGTLPGQ